MKRKTLFFIILLLNIGCNDNYETRKNRFDQQVGNYQIDLNQTELGNYNSDSIYFSNLELSLLDDSTFLLNMNVPFIPDSHGIWSVGSNLLNYNEMHFPSVDWSDQFSGCHGEDSILYMNSVTPKNGFEPILKIYFKKK